MKYVPASRTTVGESRVKSDPYYPVGDQHFLPKSLRNFVFVLDGLKLHMRGVFPNLQFSFYEPL